MRPTGLVLALLIVAGHCGCTHPRTRPRNPVLENAQANLHKVESRLQQVPVPTHADCLELAMARYQVWHIYLARSRYSAGTAKARRKTAENRRHAERLEPKVIEAFQRAMDPPSDPHIAARAKIRLSRVYAEIPDRHKQIGILKRILREHGNMNSIAVFGIGRTPHYYCYYTLAGAYQAQGRRAEAVDALARALLAMDTIERAGLRVGNRPAQVLGRLLDYEPRIVLPRYQRLLPADIDESPPTPNVPKRTGPAGPLKRVFQSHRQTAPIRITLTVQHAGHNGVLVDYQVVFPGYPKIIEAWRRERQKPRRPRLPDDFSYVAFRLSFATLPTTEGFRIPGHVKTPLAPSTATAPLVFDPHGRTGGRMILKWSDTSPRRLDLYLLATLQREVAGRGVWCRGPPAEEVYVEPIRVTVDRDAMRRR